FALGQTRRLWGDVAIDLRNIEQRETAREHARALRRLFIVFAICAVRALPEHGKRRALALAHLRAELGPAAIRAPKAVLIACVFGRGPQSKNVETTIGNA